MVLRLFASLVFALSAVTAHARYVCTRHDNATVECASRDEFVSLMQQYDTAEPFASVSGNDFVAMADDVWREYGADAVVFAGDDLPVAIALGASVAPGVFEYVALAGIESPALEQPAPPIPDIDWSSFVQPMPVSSLEVEQDVGVNTDGQVLYGLPNDYNGFFCSGYASVDNCKACCMATRTLAVPAIAKFAMWCHGAVAVTVVGHIACGAAEATMTGLVLLNAKKCNRNCEKPFWNDTSIDWSSKTSSRLTAGRAECEGIVNWVRINGKWHATLGDDFATKDARCTIVAPVRYDDSVANRVANELISFPPALEVRVIGDVRDGLFYPIDYRVIDVDYGTKGRQIPYVGFTDSDAGGTYITVERTGQKLYLDGNDTAIDVKVWAYGDVKDGRMAVVRAQEIAFPHPATPFVSIVPTKFPYWATP